MPTEWWEPTATEPDLAPPKKRRCWRDKFREAFRGVKLGVRGHSSFSVHFFFAALALATALALGCERWEWCAIVGCIGLVFTAELFNSTVETFFHGLPPDAKSPHNRCLDIAAGAVLVAGGTAAVIGAIIFGHKLLVLYERLSG